jgi:methionine aminopeptidase
VFKGKKIEKGVAFPTCVSANSVVGHMSPASADDAQALKAGDLVKVDLGAHIDGYVATQAASRVVGAPMETPATGPAADVIAAARTAFDAAVRMMRPGKHISEVSDVLVKCVEPFGCTLVEGVMSHQIKRHVIDGSKAVLNRPTPEHRVEDGEFEQGEVYAVDVVVSTGEGHARVKDERETTVFKRAVDVEYRCKLKAARLVLHEVGKLSPTMLFTTRRLKEAASAAPGGGEAAASGGEPLTDAQLRMGLTECLTHGLLHAYPVLHEKPGALVAQFKGTVLLMPGGASDVITNGGGVAQAVDTAGKAVTDKEVLAVLASSLKPKKKKASSGAKAAAADKPAA